MRYINVTKEDIELCHVGGYSEVAIVLSDDVDNPNYIPVFTGAITKGEYDGNIIWRSKKIRNNIFESPKGKYVKKQDVKLYLKDFLCHDDGTNLEDYIKLQKKKELNYRFRLCSRSYQSTTYVTNATGDEVEAIAKKFKEGEEVILKAIQEAGYIVKAIDQGYECIYY